MYRFFRVAFSGCITLFFCCLSLLTGFSAHSQTRRDLNDNWQFQKEGGAVEQVHLPHTWNAEDPFDDEPGYFRGQGIYTRTVTLSAEESQKDLYLKFEAVNQRATVKVNGVKAGEHKGGYTAFYLKIDEYTHAGENELRVEVDNLHDPSVVPLKGDFNFYGGIYRDVWLEVENEVHFTKDTSLGAEQIYLTSFDTHKEKGGLQLRFHITNTGKEQEILQHLQIYDPGGNLVHQDQVPVDPGMEISKSYTLEKPVLWSPQSPALYRLKLSLWNAETLEVLDAFQTHYAFRYYRFDADSGFYLNGKPLKLIGANRHQDYPGLGNALSNDRHRKDIQLLKDMGANFFRTAHYPQDQAVLNACDSLGLLVSMEIPLDHEMTDSPEFRAQTRHMMEEMIAQHHNHPSIIIWAYMNEMFLGRKLERDQKDIQTIVDFAKEMEGLSRAKASDRYTMIPNHGQLELYERPGLTRLPMIVGWNLYFGWYEEDPENLTRFLHNYHKQVPDKPVLITEYGAGADPRIRSLNPERFDFSVDWQFQYHLSYLNQFRKMDFLSGAAVWNLFDFGSEFRQDAVPHINSKGLMSYNRKPKDAYFLYQARLTKDPFAEILPTQFPVLPASLGSEPIYWPIKVVSNLQDATIQVNGDLYPSQKLVDGFAEWKVPLVGDSLHVFAQVTGDSGKVIVREKVYYLSSALNINLGANFYFHDPETYTLWRPDQAFEEGKFFGHSEGMAYRPRQAGIGTSRGIDGTELDPLYQTQNQGLSGYHFELVPGEYEVKLLWARIDPKLDGKFMVVINGKELDEVDSRKMDEFKAISHSYRVITGKRMIIELKLSRGKTFLNGIQIISSK